MEKISKGSGSRLLRWLKSKASGEEAVEESGVGCADEKGERRAIGDIGAMGGRGSKSAQFWGADEEDEDVPGVRVPSVDDSRDIILEDSFSAGFAAGVECVDCSKRLSSEVGFRAQLEVFTAFIGESERLGEWHGRQLGSLDGGGGLEVPKEKAGGACIIASGAGAVVLQMTGRSGGEEISCPRGVRGLLSMAPVEGSVEASASENICAILASLATFFGSGGGRGKGLGFRHLFRSGSGGPAVAVHDQQGECGG